MKYLIIGNGRLAKHISHYFSLFGIPHTCWSRSSHKKDDLLKMCQNCEKILLLISDSAIRTFIQEHPALQQKKLIHMSGTLSLKEAESVHPLNTFGPELYDLDVYCKIPFVLESGRDLFQELFPELNNSHYYISAEKKALYHSLCVMSGNFTTILWQNIFKLFEKQLNLPKEILYCYLEQVQNNLTHTPENALTGPLIRGDYSVIVRHLDALRDTPEQKLYYAFLNYVREKQKSENLNEHSAMEI